MYKISLNMTAYHIPLTAVMLRSAVKEMLFIMPAFTHSVCHWQTDIISGQYFMPSCMC